MPASKPQSRTVFMIEIVEDDGDWSDLPDAEAAIGDAAAAAAVAPVLTGRGGAVSVALSSDEAVADLNGRFRGKPKPTNVLSFPAGSGGDEDFLGDIVLAQETVAREAREQGIPLRHHVQHLVVHGILHLLGYDHVTAADAEQMEALEIEILSALGIENPYTGALETGLDE